MLHGASHAALIFRNLIAGPYLLRDSDGSGTRMRHGQGERSSHLQAQPEGERPEP